jgi:hypothetical protein
MRALLLTLSLGVTCLWQPVQAAPAIVPLTGAETFSPRSTDPVLGGRERNLFGVTPDGTDARSRRAPPRRLLSWCGTLGRGGCLGSHASKRRANA